MFNKELYNANFLEKMLNDTRNRLIYYLRDKFFLNHHEDGKYRIEAINLKDINDKYFIPQYLVTHGTELFVQYVNRDEFGNPDAKIFEQNLNDFTFEKIIYIYQLIINNEKELGHYKY